MLVSFALGDTTFFASPNAKHLNASQCNIVRVGSFAFDLASGMSISGCFFCVGDAKPVLSGIWALVVGLLLLLTLLKTLCFQCSRGKTYLPLPLFFSPQ